MADARDPLPVCGRKTEWCIVQENQPEAKMRFGNCGDTPDALPAADSMRPHHFEWRNEKSRLDPEGDRAGPRGWVLPHGGQPPLELHPEGDRQRGPVAALAPFVLAANAEGQALGQADLHRTVHA